MCRRHARLVAALIASVAVIVVGVLLSEWPRKVSLSARQNEGRTEFEISTRRINGLLHLSLWRAGSRELLWSVNLSYYHGPRLLYGDVPKGFSSFNGAPQNAKQSFPADGTKPSPLPPDSTLFMSLIYQYDSFLHPMTSTIIFSLTTNALGEVISVAPVQHLTSDDYPPKTPRATE